MHNCISFVVQNEFQISWIEWISGLLYNTDKWHHINTDVISNKLGRISLFRNWKASRYNNIIYAVLIKHVLFWFYILMKFLSIILQDITLYALTFPMRRLLMSKAQGPKDFWKPSKLYHVGIHWKALVEYSQMSTHDPRVQPFSQFFFLHHFVLVKLATSSIRVKWFIEFHGKEAKQSCLKLYVFSSSGLIELIPFIHKNDYNKRSWYILFTLKPPLHV